MIRDEPGLGSALRRLGATGLTLLHSRLELASLEASEAGARLLRLLVAALAAVLLFGGAVAALSAWFAVALWSTMGPAVLACLALAYASGGLCVAWWLRAQALAAPPLLEQSLAELRADATLLRGELASAAADPDVR